MSHNQDLELILERHFDAPPERVFAAWTEPDLLRQWWGPPGSQLVAVEIDLSVGGRYRLGISNPMHATYFVSGVFQIVQPPEKLSFTWRWENPEMDIGQSLVTIEFRRDGQKTHLRLTHAKLPSDEARAAHAEGWRGMLAELVDFLNR